MGLQMESRCVRCRRLNTKLFLKGERCFSTRCPLSSSKQGKGQYRSRSSRRMSQYGLQLKEKQKLRFRYRVAERQFRRYYERAEKMTGVTGEELLRLLERRLDNIIWRLGWASSRRQARQLVAHGHFLVDNRRAWTPSMLIGEGQQIELRPSSKKMSLIKENLDSSSKQAVPEWLEADTQTVKALIRRLPEKEELDVDVDVALIIEHYSRK